MAVWKTGVLDSVERNHGIFFFLRLVILLSNTLRKFHNTSNHPPPATDSGRTARPPLYPPVQAVPPYSLPPLFSCPGQRNRRRPVPVPVTGVRYSSLLWMCTLNTLTWPALYGMQQSFEFNDHNYICPREGRKEMFYLTTHSTYFIYGYMASDKW